MIFLSLRSLFMDAPRYKAALAGDSGVGKTSIFKRVQGHGFDASAGGSTIGGQFTRILAPANGMDVSIGLWDTAGQDRFRSIVPMYFQHTDVLIYVFDLTKEDSFDHIEGWRDLALARAPPNARAILVGNKEDLESERAVRMEDARAKADDLKATYLETSALSGSGLDELLRTIARLASEGPSAGDQRAAPVPLDSAAPAAREGCC